MRIFSGRIPVTVNPLFLLLIVAIGWINSFSIPGTLIWMAVIFLSVLIHEMGHALTALSFGQSVAIELHGMGGLTKRRGPPLKLWQEFIIVLNGPLAGFLLCVAAYQILEVLGERPMTQFIYALEVTFYANLFWTVLNLLPVQPLDGGQLLRIVLEGMFGIRGVKVAFFISMVLAACLGLFFLQYGALLIGMLFFMLTFEGYQNWKNSMAITAKDQDVDLQKRIKAAQSEMRFGNDTGALQQFLEVRKDAGNGKIFIIATEYAAKILSEQQRFKEAYDLLDPQKKLLSVEGLRLLHRLAYETKNWEEAIVLGNETFQNFPDYQTALLNAFSHSVLGQAEPAVGWLSTAVSQGLPNLSEVLQKREFDPIRQDQQFQELQEQA